MYSRTSVAGVLTTFQNTLLGGSKVGSFATQEASEGLMQNAVKKDPSGIGFLSDYFALTKGINAVAYNGTACSVANVVSGTYPGISDFYEVTKGPASGPERGVHLLDPVQRGRQEDHREQLDPARQDPAGGQVAVEEPAGARAAAQAME